MHTLKAVRSRLPLLLLVLLLFTHPTAQAADEKAGYLGVMLQDLSPSMAKALQLDDAKGVLVDNVVEDSPAAAAGLEDGDVIIKFNGHPTDNGQALTKAVRSAVPGEEVKVVVLRRGKEKTLNVELGEREENANVMFFSDDGTTLDFHDQHDANVWVTNDDAHKVIIKQMHDGQHDVAFFGQDDRGFMGIVPQELNEQLGDYFGVKNGEGVLVASVTDDSGAAKAGLKAGDVIVRIGDSDVDSPADLHDVMGGTEAGQEIEVQARRNGKDKAFKITLGEMPEDAMISQLKGMNMHFGEDNGHWTVKAPKMMMHGSPHAGYRVMRHHGDPHGDIDIEVIREDQAQVEELKAALDDLRKEVQALKKDLKK